MIRRLLIIALAGLVLTSGCRHRCCLNDPANRPNPYRPPAPNSPLLLPPTDVPTTPGPSGAGSSPFVPRVGPQDPLTKPPAELLLPDALPGTSSRSNFPNNPAPGVLGTPTSPRSAEPPIASAKPQPVPTGLPGFVRVKDGVATGRKPALEGFAALKQAGYRTVVYLHPAGADVSAAKEVAEKRGLKFLAIETTPEKLGESLKAFNAAVADPAGRPVFVFDDDGVRAGALWYLHFRTAEAMNDDAARIRAKPLGLTDQGDEAKAFALAIQRYLETR
jgi:protein tyrosine phosphatase (PTP) superfamily phosphohydrolase (DUF442 family)